MMWYMSLVYDLVYELAYEVVYEAGLTTGSLSQSFREKVKAHGMKMRDGIESFNCGMSTISK